MDSLKQQLQQLENEIQQKNDHFIHELSGRMVLGVCNRNLLTTLKFGTVDQNQLTSVLELSGGDINRFFSDYVQQWKTNERITLFKMVSNFIQHYRSTNQLIILKAGSAYLIVPDTVKNSVSARMTMLVGLRQSALKRYQFMQSIQMHLLMLHENTNLNLTDHHAVRLDEAHFIKRVAQQVIILNQLWLNWDEFKATAIKNKKTQQFISTFDRYLNQKSQSIVISLYEGLKRNVEGQTQLIPSDRNQLVGMLNAMMIIVKQRIENKISIPPDIIVQQLCRAIQNKHCSVVYGIIVDLASDPFHVMDQKKIDQDNEQLKKNNGFKQGAMHASVWSKHAIDHCLLELEERKKYVIR